MSGPQTPALCAQAWRRAISLQLSLVIHCVASRLTFRSWHHVSRQAGCRDRNRLVSASEPQGEADRQPRNGSPAHSSIIGHQHPMVANIWQPGALKDESTRNPAGAVPSASTGTGVGRRSRVSPATMALRTRRSYAQGRRSSPSKRGHEAQKGNMHASVRSSIAPASAPSWLCLAGRAFGICDSNKVRGTVSASAP